MNPISVFKQLVKNTLFNSGASAFLQSIAGHKPDNDALRLKKNLQHIQKEAQEGIDILDLALNEGRNLSQDETKKVRDAYADVRVLLDGATQMATFPWGDDYRAVLESLITRFDPTGAEAVKTQMKYEKMNVETRIHEDPQTGMFVNIVVDGSKAEDPSEYPAGKWLKSHKFSEPTFIDGSVVSIPQ